MGPTSENPREELLDEQIAYYQALAPEFEEHTLPFSGGSELSAALAAFQPTGSVLELACGPGTWTTQLLQHATTVTAVDASTEMLTRAAARTASSRVRFVAADLFHWSPQCQYDVVFFGFWLSHVPAEHFASFWSRVAESVKPDGRVFFVDDGYRTTAELIEGEESSTIQRRLNDGTTYRIVKVAYRPENLQQQLEQLGWQITVHPTSGPFFWGTGRRS